jgi:adenylate cyclase
MAGSTHTFVFADLVGYTALAELEGDQRALEVALSLQRRVRGLLADHEAEQVKAIGDGLMLRCSNAEGAVMLGLRVVGLDSEPGFPSVRVGIHTGPALGSQGDWYGQTVNVAARLCAVAPGGEVLISDATRVSAGRLRGVDYAGRELHWLRNVSEPIVTYRARTRAEVGGRIRAALGCGLRHPSPSLEATA